MSAWVNPNWSLPSKIELGLAADEVTPLKLVQRARQVAGALVQRPQGIEPERPAHDGRVEEQRALGRWQGVEPGGHDLADVGRQPPGSDLADARRELRDEQRVALGGLQHRLRALVVADAAMDQFPGIGLAQRSERHPQELRRAGAPLRARIEQLGAGQRQDADRDVAHPRGELEDEVEKARAGPVHVLEDQDRRAFPNGALEEVTDRVEQRIPVECHPA